MTKEISDSRDIELSQLRLARDVAITLIRDCDSITKHKILEAFDSCIKSLQK